MSCLRPLPPSSPSFALFGVMAAMICGCGQGLHTRADPTDAATPSIDAVEPAGPDVTAGPDARADGVADVGPDVSADRGPDAAADDVPVAGADASPDLVTDARPDASSEPTGEEITVVVDVNGAEIDLPPAQPQAHLSIGPGTFRGPTPVTMRIVHSAQHLGGYDPMVEISVQSAGLFRQDAILTIAVPNIGANQPSLVLGTIDPTVSPADQQWIPIQGSSLSTDQSSGQSSVTGPVSEFATANDLLFSAVIKCPPVTTCPQHQTCNSGACQQCPTSSC